MTELDVSGFVDSLADERILDPEQFETLTADMLPLCQEPWILAREMVYRGWLTPFQAGHLLAGQADALILGSYVLLDPIGEGGMGRVYRARNWKLNRLVAIKLIAEEQTRKPAAIARFQREIRALGRIHHPNIVMALDADFRPDCIFFAMEYFEGTDLGRHVGANGPMSIAAACDCVLQTADALQHAHEMGLIHRDIKPSNLLLTEPDHVVKLLDLGLTRCEVPMNDAVFNEMTRAGTLIGTPDFMSPEQVKDSRSTDIRSDLYSLGCTFYYLLTGVAPFQHLPAAVDKLFAQCESEPVPIESLRANVPAEVAGIVRKLMAKRRRDRFQTPAELFNRLRQLQKGPDLVNEDTLTDVQSITLIDAPLSAPWALAVQPARTVALEHSEIKLVTSESAAPTPPPRSRHPLLPALKQFVIAVIIAAVGLLIIWQSGAGPSSGTHQGFDTRPTPKVQPEARGPHDAPASHDDLAHDAGEHGEDSAHLSGEVDE